MHSLIEEEKKDAYRMYDMAGARQKQGEQPGVI
jgi:hypothetical protein